MKTISFPVSFQLLILLLLVFKSNGILNKTYKDNGAIRIAFLAEYSEMRVTLGGLSLAVERINESPYLLNGKNLVFEAFDIGRNTKDHRLKSLRFMTYARDNKIAAFIGPDESCASEALLASAWNMPMISFKCAEPNLSNKDTFPTFARTLAPASKVSKSVIGFLKKFQWHSFSIIFNSKPLWAIEVAVAIKSLAESLNFTISHYKEISDYIPLEDTLTKMQMIVDETFATSRIYVFVGEHIAMVDFVRCMQSRQLLSRGDYVVVSVDDEIYDSKRRINFMERNYLDPYIRKDKSRSLDKDSLRSVFKISMSYPQNPNIRHISGKIKDYARKEPFYVPYHEKVFQNISVPIYGLLLYDSVMIYAQALGEVLKMGGDIYDGRLIMSRIFNRSYHSVQGFDVHIDSNGDAEGNYTVIALQNDLNYINNTSVAKMSMQSIGYFIYNGQSIIPEFQYFRNDRPILWIKGQPPLAEPKCGFHNQFCQKFKTDWRYIISSGFFGLLIIIVICLVVKYYRYEQTLASLLWKIDMKDIIVINIEDNEDCSAVSKKYIYQTCRSSSPFNGDLNKKAFTSIALYRGNIVAMKKVYKKTVDITRTVRKELKQMREMRHENIINFIGVSIDHGSIYIFTTYCARGSLQDVLANKDIQLDDMIISSLVDDIVKGMIYLHDSDLISHGNLRSSNCLIDSRWVCQVADFGLHEFKADQEHPNRAELELKRALWKAPEILRDDAHMPKGSQKGDVYSFGIVLYEIIGRQGPWGDMGYTPENIIAFVKNPKLLPHGVFRPPISHLNIPDYMHQCLRACWEEDPELRPDIRLVRVQLKEMKAGLKSNIFDNMISVMEKYAYNLEGLVQERTQLLYEEKKKTDMLLHQMLPRSVAESLKRGEPVKAECFDCVTILFSDIVGFTELCASSTPFEVVEMLNELYTCCDSIIPNYDVYKVETIGDAYMVVSGLPLRNGIRHAGEIASLSLHLLNEVATLKIPHKPNEMLQLRIGVHSGPCAAGVVGLKMPRYCLFGDTVNTASRMESSGSAMKIHISDTTYRLLKRIGGYECIERGLTRIKGKGELKTYWLIGRKNVQMSALIMCEKAPDLIDNVSKQDITPEQSQSEALRTDESRQYQLFEVGKTYSTLKDISITKTPALRNTEYLKTSCNCETKCLYHRHSDENMTAKEYQKAATCLPQTRDNVHLCVCTLYPYNQREQRSAPSITFRL